MPWADVVLGIDYGSRFKLGATSSSSNDRSWSSLLMALAIGTGLLFPALAQLCLPYIFTALFLVVVFSLNTLEESPVEIIGKVDTFTWTIVSWQMFIVPAIVTFFCVLGSAPALVTMILLATTTAGSVFASPALVEMAGLNRKLAVRTMIISTFLMPISLLLFGTMNDVLPPDMSFKVYGMHIVTYLLVPLFISFGFWRLRPYLPERSTAQLVRGMGWGSTLALMVFCVGVMSKFHVGEVGQSSNLIIYFSLAIGLSLIMYLITGILFARFGRVDSLTAGMLVANRNVALSFGLMVEVFPEEVMIYVAVSQFPIFLTPLVIRVYRMVQSAYRDHARVTRLTRH